MGFLTHDPACVWQPEPIPEPEPEVEEPEPEPEPPKEVEVDDGGVDAGMIVGIVLGLLLIGGLFVIGYLVWKKRKNKDTGQVSESMKLGQSKEMKSSFSK